ncbi:MAG: transposase [Armatimonadetes bacterium]|nr:transposase [Armatimonadota bacterium]
MICGFCRHEFTVEEAEAGCRSCPLRGCGLVKCPRCGYEMPPEPAWLQRLFRRNPDAHATRVVKENSPCK